MPDVKVVGQIPDSIQKKIDWLESRDKRTDELQQITDKLEKGVVEVFQSDRYKQFLDTMAKFPRYSVNNSLLIMMQKPDAQLCQSFTGWKQMGRYVKREKRESASLPRHLIRSRENRQNWMKREDQYLMLTENR